MTLRGRQRYSRDSPPRSAKKKRKQNVKGTRETETSMAGTSDEIEQKFTSASLARAMTLTTSFPLVSQNSLANLFLMA
jgi:hypothetical protein